MRTTNGTTNHRVALNTDIEADQAERLRYFADKDHNKVAQQVRAALRQYLDVRAGKSVNAFAATMKDDVAAMRATVDALEVKVTNIFTHLDQLKMEERQVRDLVDTLVRTVEKLTELAARKRGFFG